MNMYHGSPCSQIVLDERPLFLTSDVKVAESYALGKTLTKSASVKDRVPTIFTIQVKNLLAFDLRMPGHQNKYDLRRGKFNETLEVDEQMPKRTSEGFIQRTGLPGYGWVEPLHRMFPEYNALWVDEGSQGKSLVMFSPKKDCRILGFMTL